MEFYSGPCEITFWIVPSRTTATCNPWRRSLLAILGYRDTRPSMDSATILKRPVRVLASGPFTPSLVTGTLGHHATLPSMAVL